MLPHRSAGDPDDIHMRDVEILQAVISLNHHWKDPVNAVVKLGNNLNVIRKYIYFGEKLIMDI